MSIIFIAFILFGLLSNVSAFRWGKSTYTCDKNIPEVSIDDTLSDCLEGKDAYWTVYILADSDEKAQKIEGVWIVDANGNSIAFNRSIGASIRSNQPLFELAKLSGKLPAPTRGNTLTYTFCFRHYDGTDWYEECSSDTVNLFMKSLSEIECTKGSDCNYNEFCQDNKCKLLNCGECEHIEDNQCKKYECCQSFECSVGNKCENHKCVILECKDNEVVNGNGCEILSCGLFKKASSHQCVQNNLVICGVGILVVVLIGGGWFLAKKKKLKRR